MRIGSEKSPPGDDVASVMGGVGRSFLEGGGPIIPGLVDDCFGSSGSRRGGLEGPDLEPEAERERENLEREERV